MELFLSQPPDFCPKCCYIQNEVAVRDRQQIDLAIDPAPDLVIEVDYQSGSLDKLPLYAAMQVLELWRWSEETVQVLLLNDGRYVSSDNSRCFPAFPFAQLDHALSQRHESDETTLIRQFRAFLQSS